MSAPEAAVWAVELDQPLAVTADLAALLDERESAAAGLRRDPLARARYTVAHGALREILGAAIGVAPASVRLTRTCRRCGHPEHGRPEVDGSGVSFSLAHSGSVGAIALSERARVGVDVEVVRPRPHLDRLAARVLRPDEHHEWSQLPPHERLDAFLEHWTAREAYLKATGVGVRVPLATALDDAHGWTVATVDIADGAVAAVAVEGEGEARVRAVQWRR